MATHPVFLTGESHGQRDSLTGYSPWVAESKTTGCTEAMQLVVDYCFHEKGFTILWGDYFPENPASGRVMEKCGFKDTGKEVLCPNLMVGSDRPVRVMKLAEE